MTYRRPVREAGGPRPTARCALGRKVFCIGRSWAVIEELRRCSTTCRKSYRGILDGLTRRGALSEAGRRRGAARGPPRAARGRRRARRGRAPSSSRCKKRAVGVDVIKSVTPGQMVVKIVHDELVATLGSDAQPIDLNAAGAGADHDGRPAGLRQNHHHRQDRQAPHRARQPQGADGLARHAPSGGDGAARGARPAGRRRRPCRSSPARRRSQIASRAHPGRAGSAATTWCCSTPPAASRSTKTMMAEAAEVKRAANPHEVLLVADALTGQDAVNLARSFDERVGLTGIVLTRVDGDGRGGAALSMRAVTGKPIKLIGTGEKHGRAGGFRSRAHRRPHPRHGRHRLAGREGRGQRSTREKAMRAAERMRKGAVRPQRPARAARPDAEDGRHERADGHAARRRQDEEPDRRAQSRRQRAQAPDGDHRLDDAERAQAIPTSSRPAARSASPRAPAPRSKRSTSS